MNRRTAFTITELVIAIILLSGAVVAVGQFVVQVKQGLRDRALSRQIGWEIENLREQICSWPLADVTAARIAAVECSPALQAELEEVRWEAEVLPLVTPLRAMQVTLRLKCKLNEQIAEPESLTFWIESEASDAK
jgi:hypothetical protein